MSKLAELEKEQKILNSRVDAIRMEMDAARNRLKMLDKDLVAAQHAVFLKKNEIRSAATLAHPPAITDHALIRYLERKLGLDMDVIRAEILTDDLIAAAATLGGKCTYGKFVIKDNTVVTVLP